MPLRKKDSVLKKYTFVLPLIFILGLAYCRYTFIINPNISGESFLIGIKTLSNDQLSLSIKSIIIYWFLFFHVNVALFITLFSSFKKVKTIGFLFLLISSFSVLFFVIDAFWIKSVSFFSLASILKNFLLSPMFTAIAYIMVEYFHWFAKPS